MSDEQYGFLFAFKLYGHPQDPMLDSDSSVTGNSPLHKKNNFGFASSSCSSLSSLDTSDPIVDSLENFVHRITHSDIIHVEIIPVVGVEPASEGIILQISPIAYSAYVGVGFNEHDSSFCMTDPTYKLVYVPMNHVNMSFGMQFLASQRGKQYNYLALPLTVLPSCFKKRNLSFKSKPSLHHAAFADCKDFPDDDERFPDADIPCHALLHSPLLDDQKIASTLLNPSKVFCSQMGLSICYLCNVFSNINFENGRGDQFLDPMCCTPSELYSLLSQCQQVVLEWPKTHVLIVPSEWNETDKSLY